MNNIYWFPCGSLAFCIYKPFCWFFFFISERAWEDPMVSSLKVVWLGSGNYEIRWSCFSVFYFFMRASVLIAAITGCSTFFHQDNRGLVVLGNKHTHTNKHRGSHPHTHTCTRGASRWQCNVGFAAFLHPAPPFFSCKAYVEALECDFTASGDIGQYKNVTHTSCSPSAQSAQAALAGPVFGPPLTPWLPSDSPLFATGAIKFNRVSQQLAHTHTGAKNNMCDGDSSVSST